MLLRPPSNTRHGPAPLLAKLNLNAEKPLFIANVRAWPLVDERRASYESESDRQCGNDLAQYLYMERRSGYRALIVEDDGAILNLVKIVLERENFNVEGVRTGSQAIELLTTVTYDLLIVDLMLPEIGGEGVLDYLELTQPKALRRVIVTTASPGRISCEFLQRVCHLLAKPFDIDELVLKARECMEPDSA